MNQQDRIEALETENERLRVGIRKAVSDIFNWTYSRKSRRIADIHDDLKSLVSKNG